MPLPHFNNITTARELWEPVYKNLFEVTFVLPVPLQNLWGGETVAFLTQQAVTATLPSYPDIETKQQRYKYSTREYMGMPNETSLKDISIKFNLNQQSMGDSTNMPSWASSPQSAGPFQIPTWRIVKDWYDLAWNNEDGSLHYKRNMVGQIVVHVHDREGHIIRRVVYYNAQLTGFEGFKGGALDWASAEIVDDFAAKFVVDYWQDYYY